MSNDVQQEMAALRRELADLRREVSRLTTAGGGGGHGGGHAAYAFSAQAGGVDESRAERRLSAGISRVVEHAAYAMAAPSKESDVGKKARIKEAFEKELGDFFGGDAGGKTPS